MSEEYYRQKYLKYKTKYLELQEQIGGWPWSTKYDAFLSILNNLNMIADTIPERYNRKAVNNKMTKNINSFVNLLKNKYKTKEKINKFLEETIEYKNIEKYKYLEFRMYGKKEDISLNDIINITAPAIVIYTTTNLKTEIKKII